MDNRNSTANILVGLALAGTAASIGFYSNEYIWALCLFPAALRLGRTAGQCYGIALAFYLIAGMGLIPGIHTLSGDLISALLVWILPAAALAAPFALVQLFPRSGVMIAFTLTILPPVGLFSLPTALIASGQVFPGTGIFGLCLIVMVYQAIYSLRVSSRSASLLFIFLVGISSYTAAQNSTPSSITWTGIDTDYHRTMTSDKDYAQDYRIQTRVSETLNGLSGDNIAVFPEAAGGRLTEAALNRLKTIASTSGRPYLIGGEEFAGNGQLNNVLVHITSQGSDVVYRQRMPAPWFMWRGTKEGYFTAGLSRPATFDYREQRVGTLICYEIGLPYLVLQTHRASPDIVLFASNWWWGRDTNLPSVVRLHAESWSKLFGVPYIIAMNT